MKNKFIIVIQRFPALIIAATIVLAGAAGWFGADVSKSLKGGGFMAIGAESTQVSERIQKDFGDTSANLVVVAEAKNGSVITNAETSKEVGGLATALSKHDGVKRVDTYFTTHNTSLLSKDNHRTLLLVSLEGNETHQSDIASVIKKANNSDTLSLRYGGMAAINSDVTEQVAKDLSRAETISFAILAILLVIVFRGFIAALLPLILGGLTILGAFAALKLIAGVTPVVEYATNVIILLGLGLAIDYALLIVSRFREELHISKGDVNPALARTLQTAGRTVLFSGLTVIVSLASLIIFPLDFLRSLGIGGVAAVIIALAAALVVLPAILRLLGNRVNWLSFGDAKRLGQATESGAAIKPKQSIWYKTGSFFMKRPVATLIVSLGLLVIAMIPAFHAQLASPDVNVLPNSSEGRKTAELIKSDFSTGQDPITILYTPNQPLQSHESINQLRSYTKNIETFDNVKKVESIADTPQSIDKNTYEQFLVDPTKAPTSLREYIEKNIKQNAILITITPSYADSSPSDAQVLVKKIRDTGALNASIKVGGFSAEFVDQLAVLNHYLPLAIAIIAVALFTLLFLMLGSVVIPLKAMIQNLLSLGATFGGMALLFGDGFMADILHLSHTGVIYATIPALVFAIAFGLSMDYSVFLYGRVKEHFDKTGDNDKAVLVGLQKTGSIITSAALLLLVVVLAFATSSIAIMQQIGIGLALAIALDAIVVRMVLVPSTMKLLGKYNWWAPKRLKAFQERLGLGEKD